MLYNKLLINCAFVGLLYKSEKEITRLATHAFAKPLFKQKSEKYYLFWVGIYSLGYPARKAHAPCYLPSVACLTLPYIYTLPIKGTILKLLKKQNVCFGFLYKTLFIARTERDTITNIDRAACKPPIIHVKCYWNLHYSQQIFGRYSYIKFHENPFCGRKAVPVGRTHWHDEADSRSPQFCEHT